MLAGCGWRSFFLCPVFPRRDGRGIGPRPRLVLACRFLGVGQFFRRRILGVMPRHAVANEPAVDRLSAVEHFAERSAVLVLAMRFDSQGLAEDGFRQGLLGPRAVVLPKLRRVNTIKTDLVLLTVDKQRERVAIMDADHPAD